MRKYILVRCDSKRINWDSIPKTEISCFQKKPMLPIEAYAQMCWDETGISVKLCSTEPEILARYHGDYDPVCRDSCLELFLCPDSDDGRYFNFEFNPNGASFVGFGLGRADRIRLHPWDVRKLFSVVTEIDGNSWNVSFNIPTVFVQLFIPDFSPKMGHRMRGNIYKCGDDIVPEHELSWNPITNGNDDFHQPDFFGNFEMG